MGLGSWKLGVECVSSPRPLPSESRCRAQRVRAGGRSSAPRGSAPCVRSSAAIAVLALSYDIGAFCAGGEARVRAEAPGRLPEGLVAAAQPLTSSAPLRSAAVAERARGDGHPGRLPRAEGRLISMVRGLVHRIPYAVPPSRCALRRGKLRLRQGSCIHARIRSRAQDVQPAVSPGATLSRPFSDLSAGPTARLFQTSSASAFAHGSVRALPRLPGRARFSGRNPRRPS